MNKLFSLTQPVIFAHRGACAHAPENTIASFKKAIEHGAEAMELDVKLSKDGEIVVIHDQTLDRTTDGSGDIRKYTLAELKKYDAGLKFSAEFKNERIPTLREVFEAVSDKLFINVELTNYASPFDSLVDKVCHLVSEFKIEEKVMFSSFRPLNLVRSRRLLPEVPVGLLTLEKSAGFLGRAIVANWVSPSIIHPYYLDATGVFIDKSHRIGRRVHTWTVNDPELMKKLSTDKVDGIFTDDPRLAIQLMWRGNG